MYLDSAYIAKYYVHEPDSLAVRNLIRGARHICSSAWAIVEVICVFHRHAREGSLTVAQTIELIDLFGSHVENGFWNLIPLTEALLISTASLVRRLPSNVPLRAGDAIHLASALGECEAEICTNDRHLLSATQYFGLVGRTVAD